MSGRWLLMSASISLTSASARSRSRTRPSITGTKPASSDPPTTHPGNDVLGVLEGDVAAEQPCGFRPPLVLLRAFAVAPRRIVGLETGERDAGSVACDSRRRAQPSGGAGFEILHPPVHRGTDFGRV